MGATKSAASSIITERFSKADCHALSQGAGAVMPFSFQPRRRSKIPSHYKMRYITNTDQLGVTLVEREIYQDGAKTVMITKGC